MDDRRDWKTEAEELRRVVDELRARLLALSRTLPADYVADLEKEAAGIEADAPGGDVFEGWRDTIDVVPADVATEMKLLWERTGPRRRA